MGNEKSKADPCLNCSMNRNGLTAWLGWINDNVMVGNKKVIKIAQRKER